MHLVPHPRYGDQVIPSHENVDADELRASFWRYGHETIFPESAIRGDVSKQKYATFPRPYYVDVLKTCRTCERAFLFFALEQKYWHEDLGFWIDADCVLCPDCRATDQRIRRHFRRYSDRIGRADLSDRDLQTLLSDAVFLAEAGIIRHEQHLRNLLARGRRRLPGSKVTAALSKLLDTSHGA